MAQSLTTMINKFNRIYEPLTLLNEQLANAIVDHAQYPLWVYGDIDRKEIGSFISDLEYQDDDAVAGSTTYLPAAVGLPLEFCHMAVKINALRKKLVVLLKEVDKEDASLPKGVLLSKYILDKVQLRRLNRKATLRQFIVLDKPPQSLNFMWSKPTVTKRLTKAQAENVALWHIKQVNKSEIRDKLEYELKLILMLPDDEVVAKVYKASIRPRVNIVIDNVSIPVKTALMPLFYPAKSNDTLPDIAPLPELQAPKKRLKRSDIRLEKEPYAPLLKIHRYKN